MTQNYLTQRVHTGIAVALVGATALWAGQFILSIAHDSEKEFSKLNPEVKLLTELSED